MNPGVLFALIALVCFGVGDFLIQKTTRRYGSWLALFYITAFGAIMLVPFVWGDIAALIGSAGVSWYIIFLLLASAVALVADLFEFEAFRQGKIAVMEPILAFEVVVTAVIAVVVIHEHLTTLQLGLIGGVVLGIFLVSTRSLATLKQMSWEKGVWYAVIATIAMGLANFLFGVGARATSPLLINWFINVFIAVVTGMYVVRQARWKQMRRHWKKHVRLLISVGVIDNAAWVALAYSFLFIPISISIALSESYIVLAALLGVFITKEKLRTHQFIGLALTASAAAALAALS